MLQCEPSLTVHNIGKIELVKTVIVNLGRAMGLTKDHLPWAPIRAEEYFKSANAPKKVRKLFSINLSLTVTTLQVAALPRSQGRALFESSEDTQS